MKNTTNIESMLDEYVKISHTIINIQKLLETYKKNIEGRINDISTNDANDKKVLNKLKKIRKDIETIKSDELIIKYKQLLKKRDILKIYILSKMNYVNNISDFQRNNETNIDSHVQQTSNDIIECNNIDDTGNKSVESSKSTDTGITENNSINDVTKIIDGLMHKYSNM
jgi:hypothetical protein